MTFGLGRSIDYKDMPTVRKIVRETAGDEYRFSSLVLNIVNSEQFRMRSTPGGDVMAASVAASR